MDISFTWDDAKAEINLKKHGVTFEEAATVFMDAGALEMADPDHSSLQEDRFLIIGFSVQARVLIVCHCYRDSDRIIRIISARKAQKKEISAYNRRNSYEG